MSGFENNIINALNALIRAAIHSPNFITGVSGWTINKDGSAEFNNLTLRGTFQGTNWVINSSGLFMYDPTETLGNLVVSITANAVTGPLGESVLAGITIGKAANAQVNIKATAAGFGVLDFPLNNATFPGLALINATVRPGPPTYGQLSLFGPSASSSGFTDLISEAWNSVNASGTSFANKTTGIFDSTATYREYTYLDASGFAIRACSQITAVDPTTAITGSTPAIPESWKDLRPLSNSFIGTVAGSPPPQYRKCADGDIQIFGLIRTPPTTGNYNGTVWGTLAAGYRPNKTIRAFAANVADGAATPVMTITANGNLVFNYLPASLAQTDIFVNHRFPLDNTGIIQS